MHSQWARHRTRGKHEALGNQDVVCMALAPRHLGVGCFPVCLYCPLRSTAHTRLGEALMVLQNFWFSIRGTLYDIQGFRTYAVWWALPFYNDEAANDASG